MPEPLLRGGEDPGLVIDQDVALGREPSLDLVEMVLFVGEHEDTPVDSIGKPSPSDLGGLVHGIAVREDRDGTDRGAAEQHLVRPSERSGPVWIRQDGIGQLRKARLAREHPGERSSVCGKST